MFLTKSFVDQFLESVDRKKLGFRLLNDINDYASNFDFDSLRQEPIIEFIKP